MSDFPRYTAASVEAQIDAVLSAWGMPADKRRTTAGIMVETDLRGIDSHGISMLIMYEQMHRAGQVRFDAEPTIVRQSATTALVDGGAGLGHPVSAMAMQLAIDKALAHDVGVVSVRNSHHFGAAGCYADMASSRGLIGIVSTTSRVITVVPTFGADRVLGTNPFAFSARPATQPTVTLDMSTSITAANKVKAYAFKGKDIPSGWVVDGEGEPVTDSAVAYRQLFETQVGGLTAVGGAGMDLGGHKGYGLAIFAQILSGALGGGSYSPIRNRTQQESDPDNIGHFLMALNPAAFRPLAEFEADVDTVVETLRATRPTDPAQPVRIPGDPEWAERAERQALGIPIPDALAARISEIAAAAGAPVLLRPAATSGDARIAGRQQS